MLLPKEGECLKKAKEKSFVGMATVAHRLCYRFNVQANNTQKFVMESKHFITALIFIPFQQRRQRSNGKIGVLFVTLSVSIIFFYCGR